MPYATRHAQTAEDLLTAIAGQEYGLLVDDLPEFLRLGGVFYRDHVVTYANETYPLLCGDIVERFGEDGKFTDRCGAIADHDGACELHASQREYWLSLSEAERCEIERAEDERDYF